MSSSNDMVKPMIDHFSDHKGDFMITMVWLLIFIGQRWVHWFA